MMNVRVARRYAEALVGMAEEQKNTEAVAKDLESLRQSIKESREFLLFLKNPIMSKLRKRDIFHLLFEGRLADPSMRFLDILAEKGREDLLADIIDQFFVLLDERQGIVNVSVKTASEFSKDQTAVLQQKLETYTSKRVRITFSLDKQIKGGFIARVGDTVFDGSIKRQLELLRKCFAEGGATN